MFRSPTSPSRICSRPPRLSSRLPRASKGALRAAELAPLLSIPFRITSFADPLHLTTIESYSYKKQRVAVPAPAPAQAPSAYTQEMPQPFSFHVATHSFVHRGGWGCPPLFSAPSPHPSYYPTRSGVGVCPKRLAACVHERNAANPLPSIHYTLSPCTTGVGGTPLLCATSTDWSWPLLDTGLVFGSGRGTRVPGHVSRQSPMEQIPRPNVSTGAEVNSDA
jgi:hypothetical protein